MSRRTAPALPASRLGGVTVQLTVPRAGAAAAHVVLGGDLEEGDAAVGDAGVDLGDEAAAQAEAHAGRRRS